MRAGRMLLMAGVVVAMLAGAATATQAAGRSGAGTPGWRVVSTVRQSRFAGMDAVVATSTTNAWAGGCGQAHQQQPGPGPVWIRTWPVLLQYSRGSWHPATLPRGLPGCISYIDETSAANVWAFGSSTNRSFQISDFVLHLAHGRWAVAKWWGPGATGSIAVVGAAVLSPTNVWVFFQNAVVEHYDGSVWHRSLITLPCCAQDLDAVSADSHGGIWVLTNQSYVMRLQQTAGRYRWKALLLPGTSSNLAGIYAPAPQDVWVTGGGQRQSQGRAIFYPVLDHWYGGTWHQVKVTAAFPLRGVTGDGHGGLWLISDWDSTGIPPFPVHYSGGRLIPDRLARRNGKYIGTYDIALIPRSTSVWGAGALSGLGALYDTGGVLLKYGR